MGAEIVALIIVGIVSVASGIVSVATCLRVERQLETIEVHNTGVEINNEMTTEVKNEANGTETKTVKKGQHIRISSLDNKLLFEASSITETGRPNEVANKTASIASGATKFLEGPATIAGATTEALGNMIKKHQSDKSKPVVEQKLLGIQETSEEEPNPQTLSILAHAAKAKGLADKQSPNPVNGEILVCQNLDTQSITNHEELLALVGEEAKSNNNFDE